MPLTARLHFPFDVWHVLHRYQHHAGPSGYDRLADFMGTPLGVGQFLYYAGETVLRPVALWDSRFGGQYEYSRYDWVLERALMRVMRRSRGALFHILYGEKNFRHSWRLIGANGNRLIATLHHPLDSYDRLFRSTEHLRSLSHVIVMSRQSKDAAERLIGPERVTMVPYGVDVDYFAPSGDGRAGEGRRILFAGSHLRDYVTLERVIEMVLRRDPAVRFTLVSRDRRCEAMACRHPGRVVRLHEISDERYRRVLQRSDLMVLPLTKSVAVTAALEAMACGVPVLSTEGGVRDYLLPDGGRVLPAGDAHAMATCALEVLDDEPRLRQMKEAARRQAVTFAWPSIAARTADVYRSVMAA